MDGHKDGGIEGKWRGEATEDWGGPKVEPAPDLFDTVGCIQSDLVYMSDQ